MFSFHKPKIYRSNLGCCICKAKSSSSRFTDSKKYENEFERCFRIEEKRSGEICNACVLLVKRWKKLSPENRLTKHWHHVVDARAGPGTKLTGNRRLVSSSSSNQDSSNGCQSKQRQAKDSSARSEILPLSSNQANNQSTSSSSNNSSSGPKRASSFSIKARAIDTNVTTFTFGEPNRRSYMTPEAGISTSSYSSVSKPQSALNSSAFESVIKRFRQRQQQQQLEAQRRLLNRQQRLQQQQQPSKTHEQPQISRLSAIKRQSSDEADEEVQNYEEKEKTEQQAVPSKRLKRSSESIGSLSVDGLRVSTLLDTNIWRKEKICCGIIFRSCYDEVAVFPKLLKPCQCRINSYKQELEESPTSVTGHEEQLLISQIDSSPPPRATKSGSISSCDSNTSGTGSMEQPIDELREQNKHRIQRRKSNLRPISNEQTTVMENVPAKTVLGVKQACARGINRPRSMAKRQQVNANRNLCTDTDSTISNTSSLISSRTGEVASNRSALDSTSQQVHSPASASSASSSSCSSRLLLMADEDDEEVDEEEDEDELIMDEDEDAESNTDDASSSIESLTGVDNKKSSVVGAMG